MAKRKPQPVEMTERTLERLAYIFGECSASSEALADLRARREAGQNAVAYRYGNMIIVGPRLDSTSSLPESPEAT